jgi:hypothetical protein
MHLFGIQLDKTCVQAIIDFINLLFNYGVCKQNGVSLFYSIYVTLYVGTRLRTLYNDEYMENNFLKWAPRQVLHHIKF